ncbi:unnamed protein product [Echinostoma caproni]|uniref:TORC_N domain-containing protein n=1 Tax=Echinostoma caproni TaxID=27848 RepID=A0A183AVJ1_9TREM|nr:unnamed protein product [Echinostoma caproni]
MALHFTSQSFDWPFLSLKIRYRSELQILRERFEQRNSRLEEVEREVYELRGRFPTNSHSKSDISRSLGLPVSAEARSPRMSGHNYPTTSQNPICPQSIHHVLPTNWSGPLDTVASNAAVLTVDAHSSQPVSGALINPVHQSAVPVPVSTTTVEQNVNGSLVMWRSRPIDPITLTSTNNLLQRVSSKTSIATESSITIDCSINTLPVAPSSPIIELSTRSAQPTPVEDSGRPGSPCTCSELTLLHTDTLTVL